MSRLRVLNVYSADGVLNQRTRQVPVKGLTLRVQTDRETLGEMQEMLNMGESRCENCSTGSDHNSHSISFISSASIAGSFHATPSPVLQSNRPICPSIMHRTNLSQGVSRPSRYVTHALAVLYRNSSLPIQRAAFQVS